MTEEEQKAARKARRAQIGKDPLRDAGRAAVRLPAEFTLAFRALSTIDEDCKSLDGGYDLSRLSQPYLRELADSRGRESLRDGVEPCRRSGGGRRT